MIDIMYLLLAISLILTFLSATIAYSFYIIFKQNGRIIDNQHQAELNSIEAEERIKKEIRAARRSFP